MDAKYVVIFALLFDVFCEAVVHQPNRFVCPGINFKNGKIKRRQRGRFVKFICNPGFLIAGERHSTCNRGQWDPPPPKCVRATCTNKVQSPINGLIYPSHNGAALHFFCRAGFILRGPADVYCDGKSWDNAGPICMAAGTKLKLFCDFEDPDICGWTPDLNHDFDWRREKYGTPSGAIGTGPSFDHTFGKGQGGHYMYIESSSRNINDTARLISPVFDQADSEVCLEFFYHMFGATIGSLRVYVKTVSDSWSLNPNRAIFSKSGNQGDRWYRSFHNLGFIDEDFQIVIEGIRGSGYVSDIAVDDVRVMINCSEQDFTTTTETAYTEEFPIIDSCENRCGHSEGKSRDNYHLTCDCDDYCYENNRCCPDFFDFCVLASTVTEEVSTTTDISNELFIVTEPIITRKHLQTTIKTPISTVTKLTTIVDNKNISTQGTKKATPSTTTTKVTPTPTTAKATPSPTTTKVTLKPTTKATTKIKAATTTTTSTTTKRTLVPRIYIKSPPTTPKIVRKTIAYTLKPKTTSKIFLPVLKPRIPEKESAYNDGVDVTVPRNNDEPLLITSPFPDDDYSKEFWSEEVDSGMEITNPKNFSETLKLLTQIADEEPNNNVMAIVVSCVGGVTLVVIVSLVLIRYYRYRFPRHRTFFSSGVSQSDVRFFSNDENLDFTLDNDIYGKT